MRKVRIVETGEEFKSLTDCARQLDTQVEYIYKCVVGRLKSHRGFTFEYVDKTVTEVASYLKMGQAIKKSLNDNSLFDEYKFAEEMRKTSWR